MCVRVFLLTKVGRRLSISHMIGSSKISTTEETFHLAHDWLIENKHYRPETNETIALEVADRFFTQEK
jgi:hypothetical protein